MVQQRAETTLRIGNGNLWRAGCDESRTSGSEGGPGKRTRSNPGTAPRSDPYVLGAGCASAIGTLVDRTTGFTLLAHLPGAHEAASVRQSVAAQMVQLPAHLAHLLTWDQGKEMAQHAQFSVDTGIAVYFADPHSPWQRRTNENTWGSRPLLRSKRRGRSATSILPQRHQLEALQC
jgi:IS30 family transposase